MPILQKVELTKRKSNDGNFEVEKSAEIGQEYWCQPRTLRYGQLFNKTAQHTFRALVVDMEDGSYFPVELLHFTDEFKVSE